MKKPVPRMDGSEQNTFTGVIRFVNRKATAQGSNPDKRVII